MKYVTVIGEGIHQLIECTSTITVGELKQKIQEINGMIPSEQRLICGSDLLNDDSVLLFSFAHLRGRFGHIVLEHINRQTSEMSERIKSFTTFTFPK
jgi:hypothetical protein